MADESSMIGGAAGKAISLVHRADFTLGRISVRPSIRTLDGPMGSTTAEPRVMQVLVALADARGGVLSRDDLLRLCWDGRIVGDDAINRAVAEVRRLAATVGGGFEVETVPRIGYRLTGVDWDETLAPPNTAEPRPAIGRRKLVAGGAALATLAVGGGAVLFYRRANAEIDALVERGRILQGSGSPQSDERAEKLFRQAIALDDGRADAWGWLAVVLKDSEQARDAAQRALAIDATEPNARAILAYQRRDLDAWTQWEDVLLGVLADAPDNVVALNNLAFFYQGMGRCRASWDMNERAIRTAPFNPGPQHRRALKLWLFGRVAEADKLVDQALRLWPRNANLWNARMVIYAFTDRAPAALALLDEVSGRPAKLTAPSIDSWRAALTAIKTRTPGDVARAVEVCTGAARLAPGLAANAIMVFSHLGELDMAYRVANGLFEGRGTVVQRARGVGISDLYSSAAWGRTQFLFIPATTAFRADPRFPDLCRRLGHVDYWERRGIWPDPFVRGALRPPTA